MITNYNFRMLSPKKISLRYDVPILISGYTSEYITFEFRYQLVTGTTSNQYSINQHQFYKILRKISNKYKIKLKYIEIVNKKVNIKEQDCIIKTMVTSFNINNNILRRKMVLKALIKNEERNCT